MLKAEVKNGEGRCGPCPAYRVIAHLTWAQCKPSPPPRVPKLACCSVLVFVSHFSRLQSATVPGRHDC
jgi:hypothetical protein